MLSVSIMSLASCSNSDDDGDGGSVALGNLKATTEVWQAPYDDTLAGSISISEETDTKVIGTFSFTCKNVNGDGSVKNITDGSFNLNKQ